jgi:hypothetical protein
MPGRWTAPTSHGFSARGRGPELEGNRTSPGPNTSGESPKFARLRRQSAFARPFQGAGNQARRTPFPSHAGSSTLPVVAGDETQARRSRDYLHGGGGLRYSKTAAYLVGLAIPCHGGKHVSSIRADEVDGVGELIWQLTVCSILPTSEGRV